MKNKALLVGINKYPNPSNELRGCINDILDMEHFISTANAATNKMYATENIKKLTNSHATKKEIVHQRQFNNVRNLSLFEQQNIAQQMINEMSIVIVNHKNNVIGGI